MAFADFPRGLPFEKVLQRKVVIAEYENGAEQRRDVWGKDRARWKIKFTVNTKTEIQAVKDFFTTQSGPLDTFTFTDPESGSDFTVRFVDNSFKMVQIHPTVWEATVELQEVFT